MVLASSRGWDCIPSGQDWEKVLIGGGVASSSFVLLLCLIH